MIEITTKTELIRALRDSNQRAENWFQEIPINEFFRRHDDVWSPSDNLDHLIKAEMPIARALRVPKITLLAMFGKPERPSLKYEELCQLYRDELAKGAQASGRYLPHQENPNGNAQEKKRELLERWSEANDELLSTVEKWDDNDMSRYQLPHPILGKLTVREMLLFTIYHNLRHASQEGD